MTDPTGLLEAFARSAMIASLAPSSYRLETIDGHLVNLFCSYEASYRPVLGDRPRIYVSYSVIRRPHVVEIEWGEVRRALDSLLGNTVLTKEIGDRTKGHNSGKLVRYVKELIKAGGGVDCCVELVWYSICTPSYRVREPEMYQRHFET